MIRLAFAFLLSLCVSAQAQLSGGVGGFPGPGTAHSVGAAYAGPGDVFASATVWGSCARVYTVAQASTSTSLCDLVAVTGGAVVCTLRGSASGFVDLAGTYCAGTDPAAACAAASGGSCKITKIYDQTGNANHMTIVTLAQMPPLTFASLNGLPSITCSTGGSTRISSPSITQAQPYTMSAVYIRTSGAAAQGIIGSGTAGVTLGVSTSNLARVDSGVGLTAAATDAAWHSLGGLFNNASSAINVDGTDATGSAGSNGMSGAMRLCVDSVGNFLNGNIMEAGFWPITSNATNRGDLSTNQHGTSGYNF